MTILFLDFDGVLHEGICVDAANLLCRRPLFEGVMREYPCVDIVVTSTWRETRSLADLQALFSADIGQRLIGVTPSWRDVQGPLQMGAYVRQAEIEAWLKQAHRAWEHWIALDDQPHLFKPFLLNLVKCNPRTGLTAAIAQELRRKLSQ